MQAFAGLTLWQAGAQPFDSAPPNLRMNRPAGRFTSSALTKNRSCDTKKKGGSETRPFDTLLLFFFVLTSGKTRSLYAALSCSPTCRRSWSICSSCRWGSLTCRIRSRRARRQSWRVRAWRLPSRRALGRLLERLRAPSPRLCWPEVRHRRWRLCRGNRAR